VRSRKSDDWPYSNTVSREHFRTLSPSTERHIINLTTLGRITHAFDSVIRLDSVRGLSGTMLRHSLPTFLTLGRCGFVGVAVPAWISKLKRALRWVAERAAIRTEFSRAKVTVDLLRMAQATIRLDALDAEIDAAEEAKSGKRLARRGEKLRRSNV